MNKETSTNIIIDADKEIGFTFQGDVNKVRHSIFDILVCRNQSKNGVSLYDLNSLKNTRKVRIFLSANNGECFKEIQIPNFLNHKISSYLRENLLDERTDLDCMGFYRQILNIPNNVELPLIDEQDIKGGDIVYLKNETPGGHHVGIYIGDGFYISRLGHGGIVTISNLAQLKKMYSPTRIHFLQNTFTTTDTGASREEPPYPQ